MNSRKNEKIKYTNIIVLFHQDMVWYHSSLKYEIPKTDN